MYKFAVREHTYRRSTIVLAVLIQPIINEVLAVDHAATLEPVPLVQRDVQVVLLALAGHAVGQRGGHRQVQLVRNGVRVRVLLVPVDAAAGWATSLHVLEDPVRHVDVLWAELQVVSSEHCVRENRLEYH